MSKRFADIEALKQVSFQVDKGSIFGVVGPDGAGKTTLFRAVCNLLVPDSGHITIMGRDAANVQRDHIGYMPQNFSLYGDLSVMENLRFFSSLYGIDWKTARQRALELLAFTRLDPFQDRLAAQLSGGMKQKLALASALITEPDVLLLDEPTYGVDPESRQEFWQLLYTLNQQGVTIMVSTPYMDEAELCHQVALLNQGELAALDSPNGLKQNLQGRLLEVRTSAKQPRLFAQIPGVIDSSFFGDRYHLLVEDQKQAVDEITTCLAQQELELISISEIEASMEDVFVFLAESGR
ncbi:ABC transporter ATP-binding protein [Syntrophomonas palmitatica]|uniref:ABC transporter ATP-binding protein n=1 Tax=Syntrophomonas palmitatica TaxID=402877 RepID=UPI0034E1B235